MPVSLDKTTRCFTVAYADQGTGFEIRRILPDLVRVGDRPWAELRQSGLDWFPVVAVSVGDALLKGRAALGNDLAALWEHMGIELEDGPETDAYFRTVMVTANLT